VDPAHYAEGAVRLVNADLHSLDSLRRFLADRPWLAERVRRSDLSAAVRLQSQLGTVVDASASGDSRLVVEHLNNALAEYPIRPRISGHDASSWHLHVSDSGASVAEVLAAEALFGLTLLVTDRGTDRLGRCGAPGCDAAYVDISPNRSRHFCSTRCATRVNVAAYRRRQTNPTA
jgi:predicted RNA-binding Zn ribbon-like protein